MSLAQGDVMRQGFKFLERDANVRLSNSRKPIFVKSVGFKLADSYIGSLSSVGAIHENLLEQFERIGNCADVYRNVALNIAFRLLCDAQHASSVNFESVLVQGDPLEKRYLTFWQDYSSSQDTFDALVQRTDNISHYKFAERGFTLFLPYTLSFTLSERRLRDLARNSIPVADALLLASCANVEDNWSVYRARQKVLFFDGVGCAHSMFSRADYL